MSDPKGECSRPMGFTLLPAKPSDMTKKARREMERLGVELPFDWVLIRGRDLRTLQTELREAQYTASLRARMCAGLLQQLNRKEVR